MAKLPTNRVNADAAYSAEIILQANTLADAIRLGNLVLQHNQSKLTFNDPSLEAKIFVEHVCQKTSVQLITQSDELLANEQKHQLLSFIKQRIDGCPLAYIVKHQAFWTLDLIVSENTLIPRADSEVLVETAVSLPLQDGAKVIDLGTGTGAIALAIKSEQPSWQITGIDYTTEIIQLATSNAKKNKLEAAFRVSNWFSALDAERFDLIVSNPPYVETGSDYLHKGDLRFEPDSALTSGIDGLDDIKHIVSNSTRFLNNKGYLMLEHGHLQAKAIRTLMQEAGFVSVLTKQDLNGLDRVTLGQYFE